jgi:NNP family nitrate/nitrite transporter-like MFS transporter
MLNLTWIAFFLTFVVWYNLAPFSTTIARQFNLTESQRQALLLCNLALTIPARIVVGMLVDRFGPKQVYTGILLLVAAPCLACAIASSYWQIVICRLLISCVGAGFVVGIRLVGEWFDASEIGWAEGIYGGLGNFGMAAATFGLPLIALLFDSSNGWRYAMALTGIASAIYALFFRSRIQDAPPGRTFTRPKRRGALEVCSRPDLYLLTLMQAPMAVCLGITAWRLVRVGLLPAMASYLIYALLAVLLVQQMSKIVRVNRPVLRGEEVPPSDRYSFVQVAILSLCYAVTFGGELAVEMMLPGYFEKMFQVSVAKAGIMGAGFAFASLIARPIGGLLGDHIGRKPIMVVTLLGATIGFLSIGSITSSWPAGLAMVVVMIVGFFLMAGNGANFCIAPLIRKPLTGQIAGLIGAYGSVGSVAFLAVLLIAGPKAFFMSMTITAGIALMSTFALREPGAQKTRPAAAAQDDTLQLAVGLDAARSAGLS